MSDRLAISSALSVLMMAAYVLFGTEARIDLAGTHGASSTVSISAPEISAESGRLLPGLR